MRALPSTLLLLAALTVAPVMATPASAATVTERQFTVQDTDLDGGYGLYVGSTAVVPESATVNVMDLATTTTQSRALFVQRTYDAAGTALREQVVAADVSGRIVRVLEDLPASNNAFDVWPSLSPDGRRAAWTRLLVGTDTVTAQTRVAALASGPVVTLLQDMGDSTFLTNSCLVTQDIDGAWDVRSATNTTTGGTACGSSANNLAIPADAGDLVVAGGRIAWSLDVTTGDTEAADIQVADFQFDGTGTPVIGTPTTVATGQHNTQPSFTTDGTALHYLHDDGADGIGQLWSVPVDGSGAPTALTGSTGSDVSDFAVATSDDVAPTAATTAPATLAGAGATVRWALPADADLSGVLVTRSGLSVFVPAPLTSYADTGLTLGTTYAYTFTAVDQSGNAAPGVVRQVTALKPAPTVSDPTSATSAKAPFAVRFAAAAPSSARFTVDYRINSATTWNHWVLGGTGLSRTFGTAAATGQNSTSAIPGSTYQFRVQVTDAYGNSSAPVLSGRTVVPFDQSKATLTGGSTVTSSTAWLGSYRLLKTTASSAKLTVTGDRFQVIGSRCTTCGVMDVFDGSTRIGTVDTKASATQARVVLFTKTWTAVGTHTLTIRPRATAGRPNVLLDGFGVRH